MAWNLLATTTVQGNQFDIVTSSAINCTGADLIFITVAGGTNATPPPSISDSSGNTWSAVPNVNGLGSSGRAQVVYVHNPTVTSSQTFTITAITNNWEYPSFTVYAYSGSITSGAVLDVYNDSTTTSPGSITPSQGNSLIVTGIQDQSTSPSSVNDSFTNQLQAAFRGGENYSCQSATLVQATAAAINPTWSSTNTPGQCVIAAFKPAAGAAFTWLEMVPDNQPLILPAEMVGY
jgi:hypothetical protein